MLEWQEVCENQKLQNLPFKIELNISASNTFEKTKMKKNLYLEAQTVEVWFCDEKDNLTFYNQWEELTQFLIVSDFLKTNSMVVFEALSPKYHV